MESETKWWGWVISGGFTRQIPTQQPTHAATCRHASHPHLRRRHAQNYLSKRGYRGPRSIIFGLLARIEELELAANPSEPSYSGIFRDFAC